MTLQIAEYFNPLRITGCDIDSSLIHMARRSVRQALSKLSSFASFKSKSPASSGGTNTALVAIARDSPLPVAKPNATTLADDLPGPAAASTLGSSSTATTTDTAAVNKLSVNYPISMETLYGPIAADPVEVKPFDFPHNVIFNEVCNC